MAAYIELNPFRAGLVSDPKDYRFSSYGAAVGGNSRARQGLQRLWQAAVGGSRPSWRALQDSYRQRLYVQGQAKGLNPEGRPIRRGFTPEEVKAVLDAGGRLPVSEALRCRVRYFSDGLALGKPEFIERIFQRYRGHFGSRRRTGAKPMRFAQWPGLCTLRDPRLNAISRT
jgi:hypothetical protein